MPILKRPIKQLNPTRLEALRYCEEHTGERFPLYEKAAKDLKLNSRQHLYEVINVLRSLGLVQSTSKGANVQIDITNKGRRVLMSDGQLKAGGKAPVTRSAPPPRKR